LSAIGGWFIEFHANQLQFIFCCYWKVALIYKFFGYSAGYILRNMKWKALEEKADSSEITGVD